MTQDQGELVVRDLGSTNGIRINGQRVEFGRLREGDELSIAHIRFRLDSGQGHELTLADGRGQSLGLGSDSPVYAPPQSPPDLFPGREKDENPLAVAVRELLPPGVADRCRIQVIVQMRNDADAAEDLKACRPSSPP